MILAIRLSARQIEVEISSFINPLETIHFCVQNHEEKQSTYRGVAHTTVGVACSGYNL